MNPYYPTLFSPCKIGNVTIKNRICKAPQTTGLSHMDGSVSSRLVRTYEDLARGEVGMVIVANLPLTNWAFAMTNTSLDWVGWRIL